MDIDPRTYPTRMYIRFLAHQQLVADQTGQPITVLMQRLGREPYVQTITPGDEAPGLAPNAGNATGDPSLRIGVSVTPTRDNTGADTFSADAAELNSPAPTATSGVDTAIDTALFDEIVQTLFNPTCHPELYQSCGTIAAAAELETQLAAEIVATYRQIKQQQDCPTVQSLNKLL
jgi:hypothetical protein